MMAGLNFYFLLRPNIRSSPEEVRERDVVVPSGLVWRFSGRSRNLALLSARSVRGERMT
jgi:hypothetical protein